MVAITSPKRFKVASNKGGDMDKDKNDFELWMQIMGFNGKEVSAAGATIGFGSTTSKQAKAGAKNLSHRDRLAMSAVRAGLPPWTPEDDEKIHSRGVLWETVALAQSDPSED